MTEIEDKARWTVGATVAAGHVDAATASGVHELPTVILSVSSMAVGKSLQDAVFAAGPDDQFVFMLSAQSAAELARDLTGAVQALQGQ